MRGPLQQNDRVRIVFPPGARSEFSNMIIRATIAGALFALFYSLGQAIRGEGAPSLIAAIMIGLVFAALSLALMKFGPWKKHVQGPNEDEGR